MKKSHWLNKALFFINTILAIVLLLLFTIPYIPIKVLPEIAIFSLLTPFFILSNIIMMLYWLTKLKKQWLLSFVVLLTGYQQVFSFYKLSGTNNVVSANAFKVMSYNVRVFNEFYWIKNKDVFAEMKQLIVEENPDVLCLQEFHHSKEDKFKEFPYQFINYTTNKTGQVILSKYPIIAKGSLNFPNSLNNGIYADIKTGIDTVRVYNLHMESFHINPNNKKLLEEESSVLAEKMERVFYKQQAQTDIYVSHKEKSKYKTITCGDLNNNQFSAIYKQIKGSDLDTYDLKGTKTGKTFHFKYFPMRIDFIFVNNRIDIMSHKNRYEKLSDHYPVISQLAF